MKGLILALNLYKYKSGNTVQSTKSNLKEEELKERIADEVRNSPCLYDKGNRATKKKIRKRTHGLGWRMPAAASKVRKLNYEDNLDWLKRRSENSL